MMRQATLPLTFRDFDPSEYDRLVEVYNANFPDYPTSVSETRYWDEMYDKSKYLYKRYVCVGADSGTILGFGRINHAMWMYHPQKFSLDIVVDPQCQRRGIGSKIHERLTGELENLHAITVWASVKENMPRAIAFAEKHGFKEKKRAWESRLKSSEVDLARFQKYSDKASKNGIGITTLSEEQASDPDSIKKLYELVQQVSKDVPMPIPYTRVSFDQWKATEVKNPSLIPEGYFIATDGPRYVGLSSVWRLDKEPKTLLQAMTGVLREYRGRGIAIALKLRVIRYALRNNYDKIKTWNDSENAPMLAVNTKLGFKREVGWITMEKNLRQT